VSVAAEIMHDVFCAAEGPLGIDYPVVAKQRPQKGGEPFERRAPVP
jgi:hypothetical protein